MQLSFRPTDGSYIQVLRDGNYVGSMSKTNEDPDKPWIIEGPAGERITFEGETNFTRQMAQALCVTELKDKVATTPPDNRSEDDWRIGDRLKRNQVDLYGSDSEAIVVMVEYKLWTQLERITEYRMPDGTTDTDYQDIGMPSTYGTFDDLPTALEALENHI